MQDTKKKEKWASSVYVDSCLWGISKGFHARQKPLRELEKLASFANEDAIQVGVF